MDQRVWCVCRVDEQSILGEVLAEHFAFKAGQAVKHHRLRAYAEAGIETLTVLQLREGAPVRPNPSF